MFNTGNFPPNDCKEKTELSCRTFLTWLGIRQICRFIGYRSLLLLHVIVFKSLFLSLSNQFCVPIFHCMPNVQYYPHLIMHNFYRLQLYFTLVPHLPKHAHSSPKGHLGCSRYHPWLLQEAQSLWWTRVLCNISQGLYIGVRNGV